MSSKAVLHTLYHFMYIVYCIYKHVIIDESVLFYHGNDMVVSNKNTEVHLITDMYYIQISVTMLRYSKSIANISYFMHKKKVL